MGALTGSLAESGISAEEGTKMAVADVNKHGGILGRPVHAVYEDTGTDPQKARQAAERLILADHVAGIVGDYFSPNTIAVLPLVDQYRVPMVTYDSSADIITHSGHRYIFRPIASAAAEAKVLVRYVVGTQHLHSFLVFGGTDAYSQANIADFKRYVARAGGRIVGVEQYDPATKDFSPLLLKYDHAAFGAIMLAGSPPQNALIMKQARADGFKQPFISTSGLDRTIIWKGAGAAAIGATMVVDAPGIAVDYPKWSPPSVGRFERSWINSGKSQLASYDAAHAYDATMLLLKAIQKAGTTQGSMVRRAIFEVGRNYDGAAGVWTIKPDGGASIAQYIMAWGQDGKLHILKRFGRKAA